MDQPTPVSEAIRPALVLGTGRAERSTNLQVVSRTIKEETAADILLQGVQPRVGKCIYLESQSWAGAVEDPVQR